MPISSDILQAFGAVLRRMRTTRKLSQERLAFESGLDRTYISLLERGKRQPTLGTLFALSDPLGTKASEMLLQMEKELSKQGSDKSQD